MTEFGAMRFFMPETVAEATDLLSQGAGYRCLAGGGLVVPALRDSEMPAGLVSLRRVAGLRGIVRQHDGAIRIGAMTPHAEIMQSGLFEGGHALVRLAAAEIAHPVIRNMATIGGTLCRADPSADYSCALLATGAAIHLCSQAGERIVAIEDFVIGDGETARRADELLASVSLPADIGRGSSGYVRFSRVDGDYPVATAGVRLEWRDGAVISARVAIGGCGPTAYRVQEAEALICGAQYVKDVPAAVAEAAVAPARPVDDLKGSADFRRMLIPGLLRRALSQAFAAASA
jgi:carbon-monoxide dehydrogenase medium subunit